MNFVKNDALKMWILSKMRFWKCEFCQKWGFQSVHFWIKCVILTQCANIGKYLRGRHPRWVWRGRRRGPRPPIARVYEGPLMRMVGLNSDLGDEAIVVDRVRGGNGSWRGVGDSLGTSATVHIIDLKKVTFLCRAYFHFLACFFFLPLSFLKVRG